MSIELDGEIERLIAEEIQTGRSGSAKEFVSRAVKHFVIARELGEEYTPEEVDEKIARHRFSRPRRRSGWRTVPRYFGSRTECSGESPQG